MTQKRGPYRKSARLEAVEEDRRQRLKEAARSIFIEQGLDGATIASIVAASDLSTGTFYNYFGTREAVFEALLDDIVGDIREITGAARRRSTNLEDMFRHSYEAFLQFALASPESTALVTRNQYYVRSRMYASDGTLGLLMDIKADIASVLPATVTLSDADMSFVAALVIANGLDAILILRPHVAGDIASAVDIMTAMTVGGLERVIAMRLS